MNNRIDELMYHAGLTAQGCWDEMDEYDKQAIMKLAELIVRECMDLALAEQKRYAAFTHRNLSECAVTVSNFRLLMKDHFGVEE